jgi:hypothetical protein
MFDHRMLIVWILTSLIVLSAGSTLLNGRRDPGAGSPVTSSLEPIEVEPETRR